MFGNSICDVSFRACSWALFMCKRASEFVPRSWYDGGCACLMQKDLEVQKLRDVLDLAIASAPSQLPLR